MTSSRANVCNVAFATALVIPLFERLTGVTLTLEQGLGLLGAIVGAFHGVATFIETRFPPKVQQQQERSA